ncbi:hypothetical protein EAE96_002870 [Botrytis aclada]|nr:hypothetical protein EAE96_002870 [Botrytis aclada]
MNNENEFAVFIRFTVPIHRHINLHFSSSSVYNISLLFVQFERELEHKHSKSSFCFPFKNTFASATRLIPESLHHLSGQLHKSFKATPILQQLPPISTQTTTITTPKNMNTKSIASYPILSFPITTLLLTLIFIFLLYIPRLLYLYLRTRILQFWTRNIKKRMTHFEALDLARSKQGLGIAKGIGGRTKMDRGGREKKRTSKSKSLWEWDLERGDAEEEEENEWVTKGAMAREWIFEVEKGDMGRDRRSVAEESRWLHWVGRDGGEEDRMGFGGGEDEKEEWREIPMDKEFDG